MQPQSPVVNFPAGLGGPAIARPQALTSAMPAIGTVALSPRSKHGKVTCERFLTPAFGRSIRSRPCAHLFQQSKKGPAFVRYDPLSGFSRNQPLSENVEIRRPLRQSLHTIRPLRTAGVVHRQVILQDSETRTALRLASENLKYRDLKTQFLRPNAS